MHNNKRVQIYVCSSIVILFLIIISGAVMAQDSLGANRLERNLVATVEGTVWAPNNAPGDVPTGEEIPVFGARVQLMATTPPPIQQSVHCVDCATQPGTGVLTDQSGDFSLAVAPGTYWLVIRKGFFQLQREITVADGLNTLQSSLTTLPAKTDAGLGDWAPKIALAIASFEPFETVLAKMGLGSVDGSGAFVIGSEAGFYDIYLNKGSHGSITATLTDLVSNLSTMNQYHVIIIPSSGSDHVAALNNQQNLRNIRDWVSAGGWLFASEWSGEWHDNVFPSRLQFADGDTPVSAYDPDTDTWNTAEFGDADGPSFSSQNSEVGDIDLRAWLDPQSGPTTASSSTTAFDPDLVNIPDIWGMVIGSTTVDLGIDAQGSTITDIPQIWLDSNYGLSLVRPTTTSYRAGSCGTVWYSTGKLAWTTPHLGLLAHERVSVYGLMEAGRCVVPAFPATDGDLDGVPDIIDNCPMDSNPLQEDFDGDGTGYVCDMSCASIIDFFWVFSNGDLFELLASDSVKFEGVMDSGSDIIFDGAQSVVLKNNTRIRLGAQFRARNAGCIP